MFRLFETSAEQDKRIDEEFKQRDTKLEASYRKEKEKEEKEASETKLIFSKKKTSFQTEFKKLLVQTGVSETKVEEVMRKTLLPLDEKLIDIRNFQLKHEELKSQEDFIQTFQELDNFSQTLAKIGYHMQSKEVITFAGALNSVSQLGTGLAILGYFSSAITVAELGAGAVMSGAANVFGGIIGIGLALANYFMQDEESDALGEALQTLSQQIYDVKQDTLEIKNILASGFRHLSQMMFQISRGLEYVSEMQRQTYELAYRGFKRVESKLHEMHIDTRTHNQLVLENLHYLVDRSESAELFRHKQRIQECIDNIRYRLEEKEIDKEKFKSNFFKLRSSINMLCTREANGAFESKYKNNPRLAASILLRRLSNNDQALGFLAEEFEKITEITLSEKGVDKRKLFASAQWLEGVSQYLQALLKVNFMQLSVEAFDEMNEQADIAARFMYEIGQSDIIDKLYDRQKDYLEQLQLLMLLRLNVKKEAKDEKEQKQDSLKKIKKQSISEFFSNPSDRELFNELLDKIDYNYLLVIRFAELGGFSNKEEIISSFVHRQEILKKIFDFNEAPAVTITSYYDFMDSDFQGHSYDNANLTILGDHLVEIEEKETLITLPSDRIVPRAHNANHAFANTHIVTMNDKPYYVLFTGGSGYIEIRDIEKDKWLSCDNSKPFAFDVPIPSYSRWNRPTTSCFTITSHTELVFNKALIIYQADWRGTDEVFLNFELYDLKKRSRVEYSDAVTGMVYDKTYLATPNQLFFQCIEERLFANIYMGVLSISTNNILLDLSLKRLIKKEFELDCDWTIYNSIELPIEATSISQVKSERWDDKLFITTSIKGKDGSDKLVCIYGNPLKQEFSHFECELPALHHVVDWQALRTVIFELFEKKYVIATLLDRNFKILVFLIDPEKNQITRLVDGPQIDVKSPRIYFENRHDSCLYLARSSSPGQFPVNVYNIRVKDVDEMLTLQFSYVVSNGCGGGSVQSKSHHLTPHIKSILGERIRAHTPRNEIPDNELGLALVEIKTLLNIARQHRPRALLNYSEEHPEYKMLEVKIEKLHSSSEQKSLSLVKAHGLFSMKKGAEKDRLVNLRQFLMQLEINPSKTDKIKLRQLTAIVNPFGLKVKEIERDGNCFYRAVAEQLNSIHKCDTYTHQALREIAVDHVIKNIKFYKQFIPGYINSFILNSSTHGKWAENIMSHALARALNINLFIINSDASKPVVIKRGNNLHRILLGYEIGFHYNSLVLRDDIHDVRWHNSCRASRLRYVNVHFAKAPLDDFVPTVRSSLTLVS